METGTASVPAVACNGCLQVFDLRESTGDLCLKCTSLEPLEPGSNEYTIAARATQCAGCGITARRLPTHFVSTHNGLSLQGCGEICFRYLQQKLGIRMQAVPAARAPSTYQPPAETHVDRAAALKKRLGHIAHANNITSTTAMTTSTLQAHENGHGAPGEQKLMLHGTLSTETKVNRDLGSHRDRHAGSRYLSDILAEILTDMLNKQWLRTGHRLNLSIDEVSFRFSGGGLLDVDTENYTLGEFHSYYNVGSKQPSAYPASIPTQWKELAKAAKTAPYVVLEVYIDVKAFEERRESAEERLQESTGGKSRQESEMVQKRGRSKSSAVGAGHASKILRTEATPRNPSLSVFAAPVSSFSRSRLSSRQPVLETSQVEMRKIRCVVEADTGHTELVAVGETVLTGHLSVKPFAQGTMKQVHSFSAFFNSGSMKVYAAKRFFKLEEQDESTDVEELPKISVLDNNAEIVCELVRIGLGQFFLREFYSFAKNAVEAVVDTNIMFVNAFIGEEIPKAVPGDNSSASPDNWQTGDENQGDGKAAALQWLIEPKRALQTTKFSGTLTHKCDKVDSRSQTVYAFAHFAFVYSKRTVVFADLQGTSSSVNGHPFLVLFDPMTHTIEGDSGMGDYGQEGIDSFTADHSCTDICKWLQLEQKMPLQGLVGNEIPTGEQ